MGSTTPLLDILSTRLPAAVASAELSALTSPQSTSRLAIETLLAFVLGGDCPTCAPDARLEWSRSQPAALKALHDSLQTKSGATSKRARDGHCTDDASAKRQKTAAEDADDPPLFTLPSLSATSPVRKKVNVTVHARSIRFVNPSTHVVESSIPLASIARAFLLPTRGKTKDHWTVVLLPTDVPDKTKGSPSSAQQIIFGLDALSAATFETTSYSPGATAPTPMTTTVIKGEETASSIRRLLSHIPVPLLEPSIAVFRSACATAKSGAGAAGIDAYLSAKSGTLWFFKTGILWGESKPCEYWTVSDLIAQDGIRLISATGRTCSVILSRRISVSRSSGETDSNGDDDDGAAVVETEFSMVDGREQDPINAWARDRKHLFGKTPVASPVSNPGSQTASSSKEARPSLHQPANGTAKGPAWDDSDSDDEDFEVTSSDDLGHSISDSDSDSSRGRSADENGSQSEDSEKSEAEPEEEELQEAHHPLLRPGAMPRMSRATIDAVVDMFHGDLADDESEEDELEE